MKMYELEVGDGALVEVAIDWDFGRMTPETVSVGGEVLDALQAMHFIRDNEDAIWAAAEAQEATEAAEAHADHVIRRGEQGGHEG